MSQQLSFQASVLEKFMSTRKQTQMSRAIHKSPNLETTHMFFIVWLVRQSGILTPWTLLSTQQQKEMCCSYPPLVNNLDESPENHSEWRKDTPKSYRVHDSIYVTLLKSKMKQLENRLIACRGCRWRVCLQRVARGKLWQWYTKYLDYGYLHKAIDLLKTKSEKWVHADGKKCE